MVATMLRVLTVRRSLTRMAQGEISTLRACGSDVWNSHAYMPCRQLFGSTIQRNDSGTAADASSQPSKASAKVETLLNEIVQLNMLEVRELTRHLKERLGVEDMPMGMPMMAQAAPAAAAPTGTGGAEAAAEEAPKEPEKTVFTVSLAAFEPTKKLGVIKEIRSITSLALKEAKDFVDQVGASGKAKEVKQGVPRDEADAIKKQLEALGATISID